MTMSTKTITPRQLAITITDTSHFAFAGGDATRRTVIINLTEEQQRQLSIEQHGDHRYEFITSITPVEP